MNSLIKIGLFTLLLIVSLAKTPTAYAALSYGSGVYTNLCGSGFPATAYSCPASCNPSSGSCTASGNFVTKYTCDGKVIECRSNESSFANSYSLSGTSCGKTVQIDVFDKTCRSGGNWTCQDSNLKGYMVWYSGDCPVSTPTSTHAPTKTPTPTRTLTPTRSPSTTPTPTCSPRPACIDSIPACKLPSPLGGWCPTTPTPTPTKALYVSSCDELTVASGNNERVPAKVKLKARGTDANNSILKYRFYFGDGSYVESDSPEVEHAYETSGTFYARASIKDNRGAWKSSDACTTTVTVRSLPLESHKSNCSDVYITAGNYTQAPATAKFIVTGYDNKNAIKKYKIEYGDGQTEEKDTASFEHAYPTSGTYTIKGYIVDSKGESKGGTNTCQTTLYINTKPLTTQPSTGTPTIFSVVGIGSGLASALFLFSRKYLKA